MPFGESRFMLNCCGSSNSASDNCLCILLIAKGTGIPDSFLFNSSLPHLGNFRFMFSLIILLNIFLSFGNYPNYANYSQRDGSLLRNSRFMV